MRKGFTLVELSVVLVIIGILVGGLMVGQSIIDSSRNSAIIKAFQQYEIAVGSFYNVYRYYPGDLPNDQKFSGSTQEAGNFSASYSRGDGFVGTGNYGQWEPYFSFPDMAAAQILSESYPYPPASITSGPTVTNGNTSASWPFPRLSGGTLISIVSSGIALTPWGDASTTLEHCAVGVTAGAIDSNFSAAKRDFLLGNLTPADARAIDQKMDDGKPSTGYIIGDTGQNVTGHRGCLSTGEWGWLEAGPFDGSITYNVSNSNKACIITKCIDSSKFALE